jgi:Skp family chaperone for outer membrane proteins
MYLNDNSIDGQISSTSVNLFKGNNLRPTSQARTLYVQIKDEVVYQIIKHGLSRAESKLFFYFLLLDRFGDRPVKVKVAEILLETGVSKSVYHVTIAKFQRRGWFGFTNADVEIRNFCTPKRKSEKQDYQSEKQDYQSEKQDYQSEKQDYQSEKQDSEKLEPLPAQASKTPQTLQTYSDLLHTLSEGMRESFKKFCLKKIQECSFKIGSKEAWLNKHGAEYLEEFKETYSYALANPEVIPPRKAPFDIPDIPYLKRIYRDGWKDAAIHFGLIDPNSPEEEIQDESEPVIAPEVTPKPIADSDNPQEPIPPTSLAIDSNHEQFAEGDRVVVAEVGNSHHGKTGKIIAARFGSKDDKYIIALDRKSPSVRELTIKIPKGCKLTYLTKL